MRISDWSSDVCSSDLRRFLEPLCRARWTPLRHHCHQTPLRSEAPSNCDPLTTATVDPCGRHNDRYMTGALAQAGALPSMRDHGLRVQETHRPAHSACPSRCHATLPVSEKVLGHSHSIAITGTFAKNGRAHV